MLLRESDRRRLSHRSSALSPEMEAHRRQMAASSAAAMQEWVKTLTPQQLKQLGIR